MGTTTDNELHEIPVALLDATGQPAMDGVLAFRRYRHDPRPLDPERGERVAGMPWVSDGRLVVIYGKGKSAKVYRRAVVLADTEMRRRMAEGGGRLRVASNDIETFRKKEARFVGFWGAVHVAEGQVGDDRFQDPDYASDPQRDGAAADAWGALGDEAETTPAAPVVETPPDPATWLAADWEWMWHRIGEAPAGAAYVSGKPACGRYPVSGPGSRVRTVQSSEELPGFLDGAPFSFCKGCLEAVGATLEPATGMADPNSPQSDDPRVRAFYAGNFGRIVSADEVPALVRSGALVYSAGYAADTIDDDLPEGQHDFTYLGEDDLDDWDPRSAQLDLGPFAVADDGARSDLVGAADPLGSGRDARLAEAAANATDAPALVGAVGLHITVADTVKPVGLLDRAGAEESARAHHPFCEHCGKPMVVYYTSNGYWPATGKPRGHWYLGCSGCLTKNFIGRLYQLDHPDFYLGVADPDAVGSEIAYPRVGID